MRGVVAEEGDGVSVSGACRRAGMSRQNFYAMRRVRERREVAEEEILALVRRERSAQPRLGTRKLRWMTRGELGLLGVKLGRDGWFALLKREGLMVARRPRTRKTTQSRHSLPVFPNLVKGLETAGAHEVWVSDLTYLRTVDGFEYGAVVMDAGSRKIVGWHVGESLESVGAQEALKEALKQLPRGRRPIHHSDRGSQYCCHAYVGLLEQRGLKISMTEVLHCYENAQAERVIGILKGEYELDAVFADGSQARAAFAEAVALYNDRRPHLSLQYETPSAVHARGASGVPLRSALGPAGHPPEGGAGCAARHPGRRPLPLATTASATLER